MEATHKDRKNVKFWRLLPVAVLAFFLIAAPPKPAHAQAACLATLVGICVGDCVSDAVCTADSAIALALAGSVTSLEAWATTVWAPLTLLNPVYGLPAIDIDINDGFGSIVEAINEHATESAPMEKQVTADSRKYVGGVKAVSGEAHKSLVSENSTHCATAEVNNALTAAQGFTRSSTRLVTNMVRDINTGLDQSGNPIALGPTAAAMSVCDSAPFRAGSPRNGNNVSNQLQQCNNAGPAPAQYVDADLDFGSVFDVLQYEIPNTMNKGAGGHIQFPNPANDDEWAYVAAWRFCEHLVPQLPPPPNQANGNISLADIQRQLSDLNSTTFKTPAIQNCMKAISYRTACPNNNAGNFTLVGQPANCWQIQDALCHRLTDDAPDGEGIKDVGNMEANSALAQCDQNGLSQAMADYVWAKRCGDATYMSKTVPSKYADTSMVEQEEANCRRDMISYDIARTKEKTNFIKALSLLVEARGGGKGPNPLAKQTF